MNLITGGTTGLYTWEAGLTLAEWVVQNRADFAGKGVIELGAGTGLVSVVLARVTDAARIVATDCSDAVLRQAYKRRSLQCHPDRRSIGDGTASTAAFQQLQTAFEVLRDPQRRTLYDFGEDRDWELSAHARYFPPKEFRPFVRPARTPRPSEWEPTA